MNPVEHAPASSVDVAFNDSHDVHSEVTTPDQQLWTVPETAAFLRKSVSWVYRHQVELPVVPVGGSVLFDSALLRDKLSGTIQSGKPLKPERAFMLSRYQRGHVYLNGKKLKTWYGRFREDLRTPDGTFVRRSRNVRLGTLAELPTKNAARIKLADLLNHSSSSVELKFEDLVERWLNAEGPTKKSTTLKHYQNALRGYILKTFGPRSIADISREDIQLFLAEQASHYSKSALRSMRVVLSLTMGWAKQNGWLQINPCEGIKLPQRTGGRTVQRTALMTEQVNAIAGKLEEPYATLVLFLAASGLRIGEAVAVTWSDFEDTLLHVSRRIYEGDVDSVKSGHSDRKLPIDPEMVKRMRQLGGIDCVFSSRRGTPLNPGNALRRYVRPAANKLGIGIGGWHDFRHSLTTAMRRNGAHPKVISGILGHAKVGLALDVYDHANCEDFRQALSTVAGQLLRDVTKIEAGA